MKVLKFGGTSVGTVESLKNVKSIVEKIDGPVVVVVSALGGLTDKLISTAEMAAEGNEDYKANMEAIAARHFNIIAHMVPEDKRPSILGKVTLLLNELSRNYDGVFLLRDLPAKTLDTIVSFGERMSSVIVGAMIREATTFDSLQFVKTEKWFSKNIADQKLTSDLICDTFRNLEHTAIVPGFISTDRDTGEITNLGRGGSDFTAALIAAALNAEVLEIWTDVDGFMTADPRIIPDAYVMPKMTFVESMELCSFGAKVIYPPTIYPVFHKNIPIRILNTFNPSAPGTLISDVRTEGIFNPKGISAVKGTTLFTLRGEETANIPKINSRTFNAMARQGITVYLVALPDASEGFSFAVSGQDAEAAAELLDSEFAPELTDDRRISISRRDNLATMAVVGDNIKLNHRLGARIRSSLERAGIAVLAFSEGVSETTVSFVVSLEDVDTALRSVHQLIF